MKCLYIRKYFHSDMSCYRAFEETFLYPSMTWQRYTRPRQRGRVSAPHYRLSGLIGLHSYYTHRVCPGSYLERYCGSLRWRFTQSLSPNANVEDAGSQQFAPVCHIFQVILHIPVSFDATKSRQSVKQAWITISELTNVKTWGSTRFQTPEWK
jgi:hypothetical protein